MILREILLINISKQEAYKKPLEMSWNEDYTTGNVIDYLYHQKYYKLIGIDSSRQTNISISQQINLVGKLEEDNGAVMIFNSWKVMKNYSKLFFKFNNFHRII